jgi:hypothetical protein
VTTAQAENLRAALQDLIDLAPDREGLRAMGELIGHTLSEAELEPDAVIALRNRYRAMMRALQAALGAAPAPVQSVQAAAPARRRTTQVRVAGTTPATASQLLEECTAANIAQLWVLPGAGGANLTTLQDAKDAGWYIRPPEPGPWLVCRHADHPTVSLVFPGLDKRRPYWVAEPGVLLGALAELHRLLGVRYSGRPEVTAERLLRKLHATATSKGLEQCEMPPPALKASTETDLVWIRPKPPKGSWVVACDVNAAYLAACSSLRLGVGEPVHLPLQLLEGTSRGPGYWRVHSNTPTPDGIALLPRLGRWVTTPSLDLLEEIGAHPIVTDAWVWPGSTRPLEPWYKVLRDARAHLRDPASGLDPRVADICQHVIRDCYGPFLGGRVASTRWERAGDALFRPDWRHHVIAQTRANLIRAVLRCSAEDQARLWAVATDCLYFVMPTPAPPAGLVIDDHPGHFRVTGSGPLRAAVAAVGPRKGRSAVVALQRHMASLEVTA